MATQTTFDQLPMGAVFVLVGGKIRFKKTTDMSYVAAKDNGHGGYKHRTVKRNEADKKQVFHLEGDEAPPPPPPPIETQTILADPDFELTEAQGGVRMALVHSHWTDCYFLSTTRPWVQIGAIMKIRSNVFCEIASERDAEGHSHIKIIEEPKYSSMMDAFRAICRRKGIRGIIPSQPGVGPQ